MIHRNLTVALLWASLMVGCSTLFSCQGSDDEKAIWLYEQAQTGNPDFEFYPLETKLAGVVSVSDSIRFISSSLTHPIDSLIGQNSAVLRSLLQMQSLYVKYNMETLRENISFSIIELEKAQKQLNLLKARLSDYKGMKPDAILLRKVACRFQYTDPLTQKKITKDKIYYISTEKNAVVMAEESGTQR